MDDKLERILEEGIAGYANSEPLAGMEERILARIRIADRPPSRLTGWRMAFGVGLAGIVVLLLLPRHQEQQHRLRIVNSEVPRMHSVPTETVRVSMPQRRHSSRVVKTLPKLRVFPTPSPLTAEERRLMALVRHDPEGTAEAFDSLRKRNEPIEIAPLVIQPLETGGGQ
jgi:hypothetical protein